MKNHISTKAMLSLLNGEHPTAEIEGALRLSLLSGLRLRVELIDAEGDALVTWNIDTDPLGDTFADFSGVIQARTTVKVEGYK